jgi:histidinol-phosphate aminotransferase
MPTRKSVSGLVPPYIAGIHPYVPGKPIEAVERELGVTAIKLASNENPLGPSPRAVEAVMECLSEANRYPDAGGYSLREELAARLGMDKEKIVLGAGTTELIQLLSHIYLGPGVRGLSSEGSFVVFPLSVRFTGAEPVLAPLKEYALDLDAIAARIDPSVRVIYLANPNNPTGTMFTAEALDRFLEKVPPEVLVILDEAYCEYVERGDYSHSLDYVREGRYLIVLRTFSKMYGLAGLRVGYGIGHPEIIDALNRVRSPFNVSGVAQAAALAALDDTEHVRRSLESNRRGLAYLQKEFARLGLKVVPSVTNFLYLEPGHDPQRIYEALLEMGVIVRPLSWMGMPEGLRITVGTEEENQRVVRALGKCLSVLSPAESRARSRA